jgi:hypothetical protein
LVQEFHGGAVLAQMGQKIERGGRDAHGTDFGLTNSEQQRHPARRDEATGYTLVTGEPGNLFHRSPPPRSCVGGEAAKRTNDPEGVEGAFRAKDSLNNPL